jgi:predicted MFS family arabinose efflux permease
MAWTTGLSLGGVLPQYLVSSLAVTIREDFPLSDAELGVAIAASFSTAALVSLVSVRLVRRIGIRWGVILAAFLVAVGALGMATVAHSAAAVIALMTLNGLGGGLGAPTFAALLAGNVPPERQGTAFGLLTSAPQIATLAGGLALPLVAVPLSWRAAFALAAAISAISLTAVLRSGRLTGPAGSERPGTGRIRGLGSIHVIAVSVALASSAVIGMRSFLVVFAVAEGFSAGGAGLLMAACGLIALFSRLGLGVVGDRRPGDSLRRAAAIMGLSALGFALMAAGGHALILIGALLAGGLGWSWHAPLSLAVLNGNPQASAAAMGLQMSGFFVGALSGPLMVGLLAQHGGYTPAWVLCCGLVLVASAVALTARRVAPAPHDRVRSGHVASPSS